jgi:hypothetical protein
VTCREHLFELDRLLPAIAEIVLIDKGDLATSAEVEQSHFRLVEAFGLTLILGLADLSEITVAQPTNQKLVQMVVAPTEGGLSR